jgi:hypothetical protein
MLLATTLPRQHYCYDSYNAVKPERYVQCTMYSIGNVHKKNNFTASIVCFSCFETLWCDDEDTVEAVIRRKPNVVCILCPNP